MRGANSDPAVCMLDKFDVAVRLLAPFLAFAGENASVLWWIVPTKLSFPVLKTDKDVL